jgi:hypothetical protein
MMILKEPWAKDIPDEDIKSTYLNILDLREIGENRQNCPAKVKESKKKKKKKRGAAQTL